MTDLRDSWQERITEWRSSGLSRAAWCRHQGIAYPTFLYWDKKLREQLPIAAFVEIPEELTSDPGFTLECQGVLVRLTGHYNPEQLMGCLHLLKRLPC
jgi:hypothetical protein